MASGPDRREHDVRLPDGRRLEAAWWGPAPGGGAPTIVLLHEGLGSAGAWGRFPDRLAAATGLGVFAFSRFGYGASDPRPLPWPRDYLREEALEVLPGVLDAAGVRRAVLIGHSDGGTIAAIHAAESPDAARRVCAAALLAPHFFVEDVTLEGLRAARRRWEEGALRASLAARHRHPEAAFHGWNDTWLDPAFAAGFELRPMLARLRVPVLAVQGEDDRYGTLEQVRCLSRAAPAGLVEVLELPGVGHAPHAEAPDAVLAAFARLTARAGVATPRVPAPP